MLPHQQRVVLEADELEELLIKLKAFLMSELYSKLDAAEQSRLQEQSEHMARYLGVLRERIEAFKPG